MKEMIDLNAVAEKEIDDNVNRYLTILSENSPLTVIAGPAQFGYDFKKGPINGQIAKGKLYEIKGWGSYYKCNVVTYYATTIFFDFFLKADKMDKN